MNERRPAAVGRCFVGDAHPGCQSVPSQLYRLRPAKDDVRVFAWMPVCAACAAWLPIFHCGDLAPLRCATMRFKVAHPYGDADRVTYTSCGVTASWLVAPIGALLWTPTCDDHRTVLPRDLDRGSARLTVEVLPVARAG